MRLASTGWPQIWQATLPVESAIGCANGSSFSGLRRLSLCRNFLPFRSRDGIPRFPELKIVFVRETYHRLWETA